MSTGLMIDARDVPVSDFRNRFGEYRERKDYLRLDGGAQAFRIGVPVGEAVKSHFHRVNQFQVFFPSPGAVYQRTAVSDVLVHYADAFATYGPFSSGDEELQFFTLRALTDTYVKYMPGDREHWRRRRPNRNVHAVVDLESTGTTELFEPQEDALAARSHQLRPGERAQLPDAPRGAGTYLMVVSGHVEIDDRTLGVQSLGFWTSGETFPAITGGSDGGVMVEMSFPEGSDMVIDPDAEGGVA